MLRSLRVNRRPDERSERGMGEEEQAWHKAGARASGLAPPSPEPGQRGSNAPARSRTAGVAPALPAQLKAQQQSPQHQRQQPQQQQQQPPRRGAALHAQWAAELAAQSRFEQRLASLTTPPRRVEVKLFEAWSRLCVAFTERERGLDALDCAGGVLPRSGAALDLLTLLERRASDEDKAFPGGAVTRLRGQAAALEELIASEQLARERLAALRERAKGAGAGARAGSSKSAEAALALQHEAAREEKQLLRLAAERARAARVVRASVARWQQHAGAPLLYRGLPYLDLLDLRYVQELEARGAGETVPAGSHSTSVRERDIFVCTKD